MSDYKCNQCDKVYVRKKCLDNHMKTKHNDESQEDQERDEFELGLGFGLNQEPAPIVQKAPMLPTVNKTPFRNIDIPDDFPEMDVMIDAADDLDLEEAAEAAEATLKKQECNNCDDHIKDNKRVIKRLKALEKSKKFLQKVCKDQESELKDCREKLGISTKKEIKLKETLKTKEAALEVNKQTNSDGENDEESDETALFPCGQEITEGENCTFGTNAQQELLSHYKHFHEIKCNKCNCTFNSLTELRNHEGNTHKGQWCKCDFCDSSFPNRKSLAEHIKITHSDTKEVKQMKCGLCEFVTNNQNEINAHIIKAHNEKDTLSCTQCSYKTGIKWKLEEHVKIKHSQERPVCKFFLEGRCTRQGCIFKHEKPETSFHIHDKQICKRGPTCYFKSQNKCFYQHSNDEVQIVSNENKYQSKIQGPHEVTSQTLWCKYQDACNKTQCPFKHFLNNKNNPTHKRGPMFI